MKPTNENEDIEGSKQIVEQNKKELELLFKKANGMFSL